MFKQFALAALAAVPSAAYTALSEYEFSSDEIFEYAACKFGYAVVPKDPKDAEQQAIFAVMGDGCTYGVRLGGRITGLTSHNFVKTESTKNRELKCEKTDYPGLEECTYTLYKDERAMWVTKPIENARSGVQVPIMEVLEADELVEEYIKKYQFKSEDIKHVYGSCYLQQKIEERPEGVYNIIQAGDGCKEDGVKAGTWILKGDEDTINHYVWNYKYDEEEKWPKWYILYMNLYYNDPDYRAGWLVENGTVQRYPPRKV